MSNPNILVLEDIQKRLKRLENGTPVLNARELPLHLVTGSGAANRLALWVSASSLGASFALTTVGDMMYMADSGTTEEVSFFENTNLTLAETAVEVVRATFTFAHALTADASVQIDVNIYGGFSVFGFGTIWQIRRNNLAGAVIVGHVLSGATAHTDQWLETIIDATPSQTYVLTTKSTVNGNTLTDYRSVVLTNLSPDPIPSRLPIGTSGQFLRVSGGIPTWETVTIPAALTKATGTDIDTGTDDAKYVTAKALADSHNIPDVAPGTSGNIVTSNGTDWISAPPAITSIPEIVVLDEPGAVEWRVAQSGGTSDTYGVLAGAINGSNKVFTVPDALYVSGSLEVYLNGQIQTQGSAEDWTETSPSAGTFTFVTAPTTGDLVAARYGLPGCIPVSLDDFSGFVYTD